MADQYVEVAIPAKVFWQSKTLWLNVITVAAVVLGLIVDNAADLGIPNNIKMWLVIAVGAVNAIGNAILRILPENKPIAATRDQFQFRFFPKANLTRPPERPATGPELWGKD